MSQKINTASGLIHRVFSLSNIICHEANKKRVHEILHMNGYPKPLVNRLINCFFNKSTSKNTYVSLLYVPGCAERIANCFKRYGADVKFAFKNFRSMSDLYTKLKDKQKKEKRSDLVYLVKCKDCDKYYIGTTGQNQDGTTPQHHQT